MIHFYKELYISPALEKKRRKVMWKLRTGRPQPLVYIISLAKNNDLFEIYHSGMLKQKYYKKKENTPYIIGVAGGYGEAIDLVTRMLQDVLDATGGYDVKAYFKY